MLLCFESWIPCKAAHFGRERLLISNVDSFEMEDAGFW